MAEKLVLMGAGSAMFTRGLVADMIARDFDGELALVDIDPEALRVAELLASKMVRQGGRHIRVTSDQDRAASLPGATIVVTTIGVGGRRAWEQDVFVSREHGIYPPVGDTVGPAGSSRALRMVPAAVAIAEDIQALAPEALFFNYANPLAPVCRGIVKATGLDVTGLCNGTRHTVAYLADTLGLPMEGVTSTAVGYNHLTWITELRHDGRDLMPKLQELVPKLSVPVLADDAADMRPVPEPPAEQNNPFAWQLLGLFGAFPAPGDRHITEFFPQFFRDGSYFGLTLGVHRGAYSFEGTILWGDQIYESMRREALGEGNLSQEFLAQTPGEHQDVLRIVNAIRRGPTIVVSANRPNGNAVPNLPPEAVIESPAQADAEGIRLVPQAPLPSHIAALIAARCEWAETIVDAALMRDRDMFIRALVIDGHVTSLEEASALADRLLAVQAQFLDWEPSREAALTRAEGANVETARS